MLAPSWAPAHIIGARVDGSNLPPAASDVETMKATHTAGGCEILHQLIGGLSMFIIVYPIFRGFQHVPTGGARFLTSTVWRVTSDWCRDSYFEITDHWSPLAVFHRLWWRLIGRQWAFIIFSWWWINHDDDDDDDQWWLMMIHDDFTMVNDGQWWRMMVFFLSHHD